ncbi:MAG TPA: DNA polymerase IV [Candidatus Limnocylindrales bacterium]
MSPTILHVDLDAFFAAVEQRDRPELRGRPVVVGGGGPGDRGVVSTASYEARRFGVHSAMPLRTAGRLCPEAVFLPVGGRKYQAVSRQVMAILRRFTPLVEPVSIDEAFLDVTGSAALFGDGPTIARRIKEAVHGETELTISVGVGSSKLVAKVASDLRKPDGLVVVPVGGEAAFLAPLPISRLWGVGERTAAALAELGVRTIGELAAVPPEVLVRRLGRHGGDLHERALGIDRDPVGGGEAAKSVSHEHTFDVDTADRETIERTLLALAEGVSGRLRAAGVRTATVSVKVRDSTFRTVTRQRTLAEPTDLTEPIWRTALVLALPETRGIRVRLLGVAATNLSEREQLTLFAASPDEGRRRRAVEAADAIRRRFGERAVTRGRLLGRRLPAPFERDPRSAVEGRRGLRDNAAASTSPLRGRPGDGTVHLEDGSDEWPDEADDAGSDGGLDDADEDPAEGPDEGGDAGDAASDGRLDPAADRSSRRPPGRDAGPR